MKEEIKKQLVVVLGDLGIEGVDPAVEYPGDSKNGDYSSNVALVAAKKLGKNPRELAEEIVQELRSKNKEVSTIEKIEIAGPGFINFWVGDEYLIGQVREVGKVGKAFERKKIMVEFTDPNPFKEFHIGHLYSNIVGESISRLLESQGAEVKRACYQGDVGMHVAKSVWGIQKKLEEANVSIDKLSEQIGDDMKKAQFLGQAYALGATAYEEDDQAKKEIAELNKKIFLQEDPQINEIYTSGRKWSLDYFDSIYERLGTKFEYFFFESETGRKGLEIANELLQKGILEKSQGAIIFPGEKYGLHSRVFVNSQGFPTYEAKELGLAFIKEKTYSVDQSIVITGNEINAYFKVLLKVMSLVDENLANKTKHLSHGMVRLPEGKMSSRRGINKELTGMYLINLATTRIGEEQMGLKFDPEQYKTSEEWLTAAIVGEAAVKYALLKGGIGKDIEFNFDESISFDGNSGPYLQYTYVRTQSVLRKSDKVNLQFEIRNLKLEIEERNLLLRLAQFDEVISVASSRFAPSILCTYLFELAQSFNLFYQKHQILKAEGDVRDLRLAITEATGKVIKQGLGLLGIQSPDRM
jgi:arginyl-tRNA synthetase